MGYAAEGIALDDVRASRQRQELRHHLHERFAQWLDELESHVPEVPSTLAQVSETIWALRQSLTAGVAQTIIDHTHQDEQRRQDLTCATCGRLLTARPAVPRTVETLIGHLQVQRPYFSCRCCHVGRYPLDEVLGLRAGRLQPDVQQAAAELAIALP